MKKAFTLAEVFSTHPTCQRKRAFTLAEVLITLGIIGVVAALTMPTLIANHRKSAASAKLKKFYSVMSQAVILAEAEQGGTSPSNWDTFSSTYNVNEMEVWFNKYLKNNLNVLTVEKKDKYFYVGLNDGSGFIMFNHFTTVNGIHVYYCLDYKKCSLKPDGRNIFTFRFINDKFATYGEGTTLSVEQLMNSSLDCSCSKAQSYPHYCSTLLQKNNWEFPSDYPFKI